MRNQGHREFNAVKEAALDLQFILDPTPEGVDPYELSNTEAPDELVLSSLTKSELARNLRFSSTVRKMGVDDISRESGVPIEKVSALLANGEGSVRHALDIFDALKAFPVNLPMVDRMGRFK